MVNHKSCAFGELISVGTVMKTMNKLEIDWPSAPFHCCSDYTTSVTNCITTIYAYHKSSTIESSIGPLNGCQYKDGECTMTSGAAVIWEPDAEESCQYVLVSAMKGVLADKVWLSESKEFALSFSLSTPPLSDCGHSLIVTDQGYAIELLHYSRHKRRVARSTRQKVGLATTNQLAAQLLAVEDNMQSSMSTAFHNSILALCKSVNSLSSSLIASVSSNPTIAMRSVLQRSDIEAKFLGNNVVRTRSCTTLSRATFSLATFNASCFSLPSIIVSLPDNSEWKTFIDPTTSILTQEAINIPCSSDLFFEFPFNDTITKFFPVTGIFEIVPASSITIIQNLINRPQSEIRPALTLFHNLVITNISEFIPEQQFTELWSAIEGSHAALSAHLSSSTLENKSSFSILSTPTLSPINFISSIVSYVYKPWVVICCLLVTVRVIGNAITLYISWHIPTSLLQYTARFGNHTGRGQESPNQLDSGYCTPSNVLQLRNTHRHNQPKTVESLPLPKFPTVYTLSLFNSSVSTHVRITINGISVSALIDTGSSITLAAQDLCAALGIFHLDPPKSLKAIGMAGSHVPLAGSKTVKMKIADIILNPIIHFTKGSCVPNMNSAYEVIVGNDILSLLPKMTMDFHARTVSFGSSVLPLAPAIINSKHPTVLVSNPTNQPQTLYAGMTIAHATELANEHENFAQDSSCSQNTPISCVNEIEPVDPSYVINLEDYDLNDEQKDQLSSLISKYNDVFSRHQYDIGSCTAGKVHIYTTNDPPRKIRPYRVPLKYREEIQKHINMLLKAGVMKESHTHWVHNLVVVKKKDNSLRVCLDMRRPINEVT
ncbi:unnamed protein product [Nippostrongylus brasiliensis]|uniref:Peptidase A2 domain-containing protein n=1 Tax=Nippostrongylus brasiliensis TaxID=27835 RepID=A0A0N4YDS8_NIPBR|nr:unnamed protein product [Nippostrongylus brasiliensis]